MATSTKADVFYRESDGEPMGETIQHRESNMDLILALQDWFADDPLAYISGDEFVYWVEGDPRFVVSPDVWGTHGIDKTVVRNVYKTWLEGGKGPEFVIELTSPSTRRVDRGKKFRIYRDDLKVFEYFLFDPLNEYLRPRLQGYRLVGGEYRPIDPVDGRLPSEFLGLHLEPDAHLLRLFDPRTGRRLLNRLERLAEAEEARRQADARLQRTQTEIRLQEGVIQLQGEVIRQKEEAIQLRDEVIRLKEEVIQLKEAAFLDSQSENERLRREVEALRAGKTPRPRPKRK